MKYIKNHSRNCKKEFAISEFEKYKVIQDKSYKSDFDMLLQELDKDGK